MKCLESLALAPSLIAFEAKLLRVGLTLYVR